LIFAASPFFAAARRSSFAALLAVVGATTNRTPRSKSEAILIMPGLSDLLGEQ
jgi:hypothetical protein